MRLAQSPGSATSQQARILQLQSTAGNAATTQMLQNPAIQRAPTKDAPDPTVSELKGRVAVLEMKEYIGQYFDRQKDIGLELVNRKDDALKRFREATSAEYNKEADSSSLTLLSFVLNMVPAAGAFIGVLKLSTSAKHMLEDLSEKAEKVAKVNEAAKAGVEMAKGAKEVREAGEKSRGATEGQTRGDLIIEAIDSIAELRAETINHMWASHDQWATALTPAASKGVDLLPLLRSEMPMPTAVPTQAAAYASMRFEVELYKDYFSRIRLKKKSRKSYLDAEMMGEGTFEEWLEEFDLPEKLMERIKGIRTQVPKALEIIFGDQFAQTSGQQRKRKEEKEAREFLGALGDQKSQMSTAGAD